MKNIADKLKQYITANGFPDRHRRRVKGHVKVDRRTKKLVQRLKAGDIAVIDHEDLDELAADNLISCRVQAVINSRRFMSGRYVNRGPQKLLQNNIYLLEEAGEDIWRLNDNDFVEINGCCILKDQRLIARAKAVDEEILKEKMQLATLNQRHQLDRFVQNTLEYALREKELILGYLPQPKISTRLRNRHVLIVVRGKNYREDLQAIRHYIEDLRPVLIGVDGGGDALWEFAWTPDMIIGDMDSVSDEVLTRARELVVHAYPDGRAPGLERLQKLGLEAKLFAAPGTSEDIAMLLAYEQGAKLIVAVGTHSNMVDFLEKGRKGMSSTFLVRLKVGELLVDARGVSQLYSRRIGVTVIVALLLSALLPAVLLFYLSPPVQHLLRLLYLRLRFGF